jgi:hypothetical protein
MIWNDPLHIFPRVNVKRAWDTIRFLAVTDSLSVSQCKEFQAALLLFSVCNVLAPMFSASCSLPYVGSDLIDVALHPERAKEVNWAAFIVEGIFAAARIHTESLVQFGAAPVQVGGCCILLQVYSQSHSFF